MFVAAIKHFDLWAIFACPWFWSGLGGWIVASLIKMAIAAWKTHEKALLGHTRSEVFWGMATGAVWATAFNWFWQ